jgi:hypothetical protein
MIAIAKAVAVHEAWLAGQLGPRLVRADLEAKHKRMLKDAHAFLRGTCFRFAAIAPGLLGDAAAAPRVLSVGDAHVENFGLWRDAEGRLVWGVNDFDEAAPLPWPFDLIRLAASAVLAAGPRGPGMGQVAGALLDGYSRGLDQPRARVLLKDGIWLRNAFLASDTDRAAFWRDLEALWPPPSNAPRPEPRDRAVLAASLPAGAGKPRIAPRRAGLGSLGRPRFVALAEFQGAPVVREVKALVPSCFVFAGTATDPAPPGALLLRLATGPGRAPDPWFAVRDGRVVRRLAPDSRRIEGRALAGRLGPRLLRAMGAEIGMLHAADRNAPAVQDDLSARGGAKWLARAAEALVKATLRDFQAFRRHPKD